MSTPRFTRLRARWAALLALSFALFAVPGCSDDDVVYTYFVVKLDIDRETVDVESLRKVETCALRVEGWDEDQVEVPNCSFNFNTNYDLGYADFSTDVQEGDLWFVLSLFDLNNQKIAEGRTRRAIVKGETISVLVLAKKITDAAEDGGAIDGASTPDDDGTPADAQ